jgi:hypothetical protein
MEAIAPPREGTIKPGTAKPQPKDELPEEFVGQAIKHIVMHEVGHSLGLRHNFKASTMLTTDQLNDTAITHVKGLVGSVMDYSPINIAPKGKKQGDYYSTTLGPYDYWAIEYAYKVFDGDEATELKKVASRAPEHDLVYATDEDALLNDDPYVNRWDLGSDPCEFGKQRIALAVELAKNLDDRVVKDGDSWARTRRAFSILLQQWGDGATLACEHVSGQSVSRDHKADKDGRDPIVPVPGAKQRDCLKFLVDAILSDQSFRFSPALLRRLGTERWNHWGTSSFSGPGVDISVLERILGIQKIVLGHCLAGPTLARLQNQQLQADPGSDPLRMEEVFRALTDGVWSDLDHLGAPNGDKAAKAALSTIRRNLQREYLRRLTMLVLGHNGSSPEDRFAYARGPVRLRGLRPRGRRGGPGRRAGPRPPAPQGDCQPHRQSPRVHQPPDRRHHPGAPRGMPPPDRQGPRGPSRRPRALSGPASGGVAGPLANARPCRSPRGEQPVLS